MGASRNIAVVSLLILVATLLLFWIGYVSDTGLWAFNSAKALGIVGAVVFTLVALVAAVSAYRLADSTATGEVPEDNGSCGFLLYIIASAALLVPLILPSAGFFWRNVTDNPLGLFGKLTEIVQAYSLLPAGEGIVDLWEQSLFHRALSLLAAAIFTVLTVGFVKTTIDGKLNQILGAAFLATSGTLAIFAAGGDFALIATLFLASAYLGVLALKSKAPIWAFGLAVLLTAIVSPIAIIPALAFVAAMILRKVQSDSMTPISAVTLAAIAVGLSFIEFSPFNSIFTRSLTMPNLMTADHVWGVLNQTMMIGHFLIPLAFVLALLKVFKPGRSSGMTFMSLWVITSTVYYLTSHSAHGYILGFPSAAIVLVPSLSMILLYIAESGRTAVSPFSALVAANVLVTAALMASVADRDSGTNAYAEIVWKETAMAPNYESGRIGMLVGVMLSEHFEDYEYARPFLKAYADRHRLDLPGRYYRGWAVANSIGVEKSLTKAVEDYQFVEQEIQLQNRGFWDLYRRLGMIYINGKNPTYAAINFEKAATESVTTELATILGSIYDGLKVDDSIITKYRQALALGTDTVPIIYYRMGYASARLGDSARAVETFKEGVYLFPNYIDNYEFPARQYYLHGQYDSVEALANFGLSNSSHSPNLEACLILVYDRTNRPQQRDSALVEFVDYFQMMPGVLQQWGTFLEAEGLVYEGRKIQAKDLTSENASLRGALGFFYYFKAWGMPDSARYFIEEFYKYQESEEIRDLLERVIEHNPSVWPEMPDLPDTAYHLDQS